MAAERHAKAEYMALKELESARERLQQEEGLKAQYLAQKESWENELRDI